MSNLVHKKDQLALLVSEEKGLQDALAKNEDAQHQLRWEIAALEDTDTLRADVLDEEQDVQQQDLVQSYVQLFTDTIERHRPYALCSQLASRAEGELERLRPYLDDTWFAHAIEAFFDAIKEAPYVDYDDITYDLEYFWRADMAMMAWSSNSDMGDYDIEESHVGDEEALGWRMAFMEGYKEGDESHTENEETLSWFMEGCKEGNRSKEDKKAWGT
jgi:hypothetical protein